MTINGIQCISIDPVLKDSYPELYSYIMRWVDLNKLKVLELDEESTGADLASMVG
jgi:hypothetical protein